MNPCNNGTLTGRISSEIRFNTSTKFSKPLEQVFFLLAVRDNFKSNGDYKTKFYPVVAWRNTALFIRDHFVKGQMVTLSYSLTAREMVENGKKSTLMGLKCEDIVFLESKQAVQNKRQNYRNQDATYTNHAEQVQHQVESTYSSELSDETLTNFMGAYGVDYDAVD